MDEFIDFLIENAGAKQETSDCGYKPASIDCSINITMKTYELLEHCVCFCKNRIVFYFKYRRKVLTSPIGTRLKELLSEKAKKLNVKIIEVEVMPNHVHILAELRPNESIGVLVDRLKEFTSRILRQGFPEFKRKLPSLWTNFY